MPDLDEQAKMAEDAAAEGKLLHLVDPDHISLMFGPDSATAIQFGPKGDFEDGHWRGPKDHPYVPALLAAYPHIAEHGAATKTVYACPECEASFATAAGYRAHYRTKHTPGVVPTR